MAEKEEVRCSQEAIVRRRSTSRSWSGIVGEAVVESMQSVERDSFSSSRPNSNCIVPIPITRSAVQQQREHRSGSHYRSNYFTITSYDERDAGVCCQGEYNAVTLRLPSRNNQ